MKIKSNKALILERFNLAFDASVDALNQNLKTTIKTPRHWEGFKNRVTYRQNGEVVVGSYRNIVDTANLVNSQTLLRRGKGQVDISWDGNGVTPVVGVFFGQRTESDYIPGRDWVQPTLDDINLPLIIANEFNG